MYQQPNMNQAPKLRPVLNVGAGMDIITGRFIKGAYGESILMGGAPSTIGIIGPPNSYKTALSDYIAQIILARFSQASGQKYDTESTGGEERMRELQQFVEGLRDQEDIFDSGRFMIVDKASEPGEKWLDAFKKFTDERRQAIADKKGLVDTPFLNRTGDGYLQMLPPYVTELDSISKYTTTSIEKMSDEKKLGEKDETYFMFQGRQKKRLMDELPPICTATQCYMTITAHVGKEIKIDPYAKTYKPLQYMPRDLKLKDAPPNMDYLTHLSWFANAAEPLVTKEKTSLYPRDSDDNAEGDTDLMIVTLTVLRNKLGPSGRQTQLIFSQREGLLPALSEFHYCKEFDRFGLEGNQQNYALELLPDVKLQRTTVRRKIAEHAKLRRALNITSELLQMHQYWKEIQPRLMTPKELREKLIARGYDWDILLETRGWWTTDDHPVPFLSTMDLVNMYHGEYHPYWYPVKEADLKPVG